MCVCLPKNMADPHYGGILTKFTVLVSTFMTNISFLYLRVLFFVFVKYTHWNSIAFIQFFSTLLSRVLFLFFKD